MKTLKVERQSTGKYDIVFQSGKWQHYDSFIRLEYEAIMEQRIVKALLSQPNRFDTDFGVGLKQYIGTKNRLVDVNAEIRTLSSFYKRINNVSGDLTVSYLDSKVIDNAILITLLTKRGYSKRIKFVKEKKNNG